MGSAAERLAASLGDRYRIERELGRGDMATVYLAEDARDHRKVAIKILHPELSAIPGADRFLEEIELTANLQHPHILPLFDFGSADGLIFYVVQYVEGETLRERLNRERQLPIDDAIRIAVDVADALEHAHRHGVVHGDINPGNILLLDERPLVSDFGIALSIAHTGGERVTGTGISVGTPQYMAPEQAMGDKTIDQRADIYALGAVVFEMLAGDPPFTGPNSQAILARVTTEQPRSLTAIRDIVSEEIDEAVYAALQKLPADRPATAREFARMLTEKRSPFEFTPAERMTTSSIAAGVIGTAILFGIAGYALGYRTHDFDLLEVAPSRLAMMTPSLGGQGAARLHRQIALTPDGSAVVFVGATESGENMLYYQRLDAEIPTPVEGSRGMLDPRISADGKRIYALIPGAVPEVASIPITGGTRSPAPDDVIGPLRDRDLISGMVDEIRHAGGIAAFVKGDGTLWAARFDEKKAKLTEQPVQIASGVSVSSSGITQFALSKSGSLAYVPEEPRWLALVDRAGKMTYAIRERRNFHSPRFSPDGKSIRFEENSGLSRTTPDGKGPTRKVVADEFHAAYPAISPDGKWLAFVSDQSDIRRVYVRPLEGDGELVQVSSQGGTEPVWGRDGRELFYRSLSSRGSDLISAAVCFSPAFAVVSQKALFPMNDMAPGSLHANYDVSPDGKLFVMVRQAQPTRVVVIQNLPAILDSMRGPATPR